MRDPPVAKPGDGAFKSAHTLATGGMAPHFGLVIAACYQRIDPETGELIEAVEEQIDETEVDRRALQMFLAATSDPPRRVWQPVCNWKFPEAMDDVTRYSGVECAARPRVRTHDDRTGALLLPEEIPRVVAIDAEKAQVKVVEWPAHTHTRTHPHTPRPIRPHMRPKDINQVGRKEKKRRRGVEVARPLSPKSPFKSPFKSFDLY